MISKKIERFLEPLQIVWPIVDYSYVKRTPVTLIETVEELAEYIKDKPPVGSIMTFKHNTQGPAMVNSCSLVLMIESDPKKLRISHQNKYETHLLCNLVESSAPWCRWADPDEMIVLDDERRKEVVDVVVQNRIERLFRHAQENFR